MLTFKPAERAGDGRRSLREREEWWWRGRERLWLCLTLTSNRTEDLGVNVQARGAGWRRPPFASRTRGLVVLWNDRDMKIHEGEIFIFPYNIMNRRAKGSMYIQDS